MVAIRTGPREVLMSGPTDVRFGSKADMCSAKLHVRFTPKSGHVQCNSVCPLCARSGHCGCSCADTLKHNAIVIGRYFDNLCKFQSTTFH